LNNDEDLRNRDCSKETIILSKLTDEIKEGIAELAQLCSENNLKAKDSFELLKKSNLRQYFSEYWLNLLEVSINSYDFEKAFEILRELNTYQ
jgi:hypothetical protein